MNQRLSEWLDALRSGKYRQGRDVLKSSGDSYCCLGVACELSDVGSWTPVNGSYGYKIEDLDTAITLMPRAVAKELDLPEKMNTYGLTSISNDVFVFSSPDDVFMVRVSTMNDDGYLFAQIADAIEYTYERLMKED